jgi:UDP-N-acetylmuramoylalanine--D-glutamate ligase
MAKRLVILGAGESGCGTALLGLTKGYDTFVSDFGKIKPKYSDELSEMGVEWESEKHTEAKILNADIIVKSPGIPEKSPIIKKALEAGIKIVSEIEFAAGYTDAKLIGITGTNGKTTTTLLIHHILKNAGINVGLGGNIGKSFARQVANSNTIIMYWN